MHLPSLHAHGSLGLPWALALVPLGVGLGYAYFAVLRCSVDRLVSARPGAIALLLSRLVASALVLAAAAWWGPAALLALFGGFLIARAVVLRVAVPTRAATRTP